MSLRYFLHQRHSFLATPETAKKLLRLFSALLVVGIFIGAYSFLHSTFSREISERRGYMSSAISEAQIFFTNRGALLESLSLSAVRSQPTPSPSTPSTEEIHLRLGKQTSPFWSIWLTQRMRDYLKEKKVNLLYINASNLPQVTILYSADRKVLPVPQSMLDKLYSLKLLGPKTADELWLTDQSAQTSQLYIFTRLDERTADSGWLGLEMDGKEVSRALSDQSAGDFMMLNSVGTLIFTNSKGQGLSQALLEIKKDNFFGFIGGSLLPDYLVIRKNLKSSDWQLVYAIDLWSLFSALRLQIICALLFCVLCTYLVLILTRRIEHRLINPAMQRMQELIESEAFSRAVIQTAPVALCVLRRTDGHVALDNTLSRQWLGIDYEQDTRSKEWITKAFSPTSPKFSDYFEAVDGRQLYLSCAPTRYKGEDVLLCAFSDLSARKKVEATLEQARQLADAANSAKTLFLATMSHEIRTPLYGVLGTLELLSRTQLNAQQNNYLAAIEGSSATLLQLICDVLDVSKIEAGQLDLELSKFASTHLIYQVIQGYAAAARTKGLKLYTCYDPGLPEWLIGDTTRIRQILNNLISNAVKFTDTGHVVLRVKLLKQDDERATLLLQVSDTGIGIAHESQQHIFEPFYQTEGTKNVVMGTGLGLPICLRLANLMNGNIRIVSKLGLGSSFTLTLPLETSTPDINSPPLQRLLEDIVYVVSPLRELAESISGWLRRWGAHALIGLPPQRSPTGQCILLELHPGRFDQSLASGWSGPVVVASVGEHGEARGRSGVWHVNLNHLQAIHHAISEAQGLSLLHPQAGFYQPLLKRLHLHVLVAEDNLINQLILRDQLEELGCTVQLAKDGQEALLLWAAGQFDVVLTDVNMPTMNGYELATKLRQIDSQVPIIGATANAMRGEEQQCLAAGMNFCLIKPFTLKALFNSLLPYERTLNETL